MTTVPTQASEKQEEQRKQEDVDGFDLSGTTTNNTNDNTSKTATILLQELNEQVAPILQRAMSKKTSQYAILLSANIDMEVVWHFPTDPVIDYDDGTCWIEARLRRLDNDELLVVTGWSLKRRRMALQEEEDEDEKQQQQQQQQEEKYSPWLLDGLDWQDFREEFRPGIGREEWERICG